MSGFLPYVQGVKVFVGGATFAPGRGGIARVARMTARALAEEGADLKLASFLDAEPIRIAGADASLGRGKRWRFLASCHAGAFDSDRFIYDSVGTARAHARIPGLRRPYAVWIHGIEVWHGLRRDRERALRGAALVLSNSDFTLERFRQQHFDLPGARVCALATEDDCKPAADPSFHGPPTVLILSRIEQGEFYKGHRELIEIWPCVADAVPDAELVVAGHGSGLEEVRALAQASPARESIEVVGFVPESEIEGLWAKSWVFAMPSRGEGFGLVYAEAMRNAIPVVASVHDAGCEVNVDGETGFNVDLDRPSDLKERLIALLRDPELCARIGKQGREHWSGKYRYSAFRNRLLESLST